jgi:hypothetical protein
VSLTRKNAEGSETAEERGEEDFNAKAAKIAKETKTEQAWAEEIGAGSE